MGPGLPLHQNRVTDSRLPSKGLGIGNMGQEDEDGLGILGAQFRRQLVPTLSIDPG